MQFSYSDDERRWHTLSYETRRLFGCRAVKVMLDAGMTCPNRDGSKGLGGCTFCSARGAGETNRYSVENLLSQYDKNKEQMLKKWPESKTIPYFQSFSNTYAPSERVEEILEPFLKKEEVAAIAVATRADCLTDEILAVLAKANAEKPVWLELGLQTSNDRTAERINRCHTFAEFRDGVYRAKEKGLRICVHVLNGLPGETKEDMLKTAEDIARLPIDGVKFHMLNVLKDSALGREYLHSPFPLLSEEEYIDILIRQLEILSPEMTVERVSGDPVHKDLLAPEWVLHKKTVLNHLKNEMIKRDTRQGKKFIPEVFEKAAEVQHE